ncbi:MAG: hypothetical protein ACLTDM_22450 [Clostridium butyricum]
MTQNAITRADIKNMANDVLLKIYSNYIAQLEYSNKTKNKTIELLEKEILRRMEK